MFESLFRNKTLRYRALLVLLCLYVGAVILDQTINPDQANLNPTPQLNEPDLYMIKASISQINSRGELQSKIAAERFTHYPLTDVTALDRPNLELFAQDSDMPWTISSSQGRLLEGSKYRKQAVELWNSVLAEKRGLVVKKPLLLRKRCKSIPMKTSRRAMLKSAYLPETQKLQRRGFGPI